MTSGPSRRRPISRGKRVVFTILVVLLVYGVIETVAWRLGRAAELPERVEWAVDVIRDGGNPFRYAPHPYTLYMPRPGFVGMNGEAQHNSLGFRGEEIAAPKPPGTFRIVCLGGSTTYSDAVESPSDAYPAQLEAFLRRTTGSTPIEVVNAGAAAALAADAMVTFAFRVEPIEPDLIVVHTGLNDCEALLAPGLRPDFAHVRARFVTPRRTAFGRALLRSPTYRLIFSRTVMPVMLFRSFGLDQGQRWADHPPEPTGYRASLESLVLMARSRGVRILFANEAPRDDFIDDVRFMAALKRLRAAGEEVAAAHRIAVCHFERFRPPPSFWDADGVHLRPRGTREKAAFIGRDLIRFGLAPPAGPTTRSVSLPGE